MAALPRAAQDGPVQTGEAAMIGYVRAPGAFARTRAMARAVGLDLTAAVVDGWLSRSELETLIGRCATCGRGEDCARFLSSALPGAALPALCANGAALQALGE